MQFLALYVTISNDNQNPVLIFNRKLLLFLSTNYKNRHIISIVREIKTIITREQKNLACYQK
ncbi:hypothetical protein VV11_000105, partial [Trichodesmium erythraeum 21-75]|nr:hypothetical protein [Trichodesmium erythraeum 21-75]